MQKQAKKLQNGNFEARFQMAIHQCRNKNYVKNAENSLLEWFRSDMVVSDCRFQKSSKMTVFAKKPCQSHNLIGKNASKNDIF
jgi:hypothetical protein